jgi:hypothetical protein
MDDRCRTEQDCTHDPWCRINGECHKASAPAARRVLVVEAGRPGTVTAALLASGLLVNPDCTDGVKTCEGGQR